MSMINEHSKTVQSYEPDITIEHLKASFDSFISKFKQADISVAKCTLIEQMITPLVNLPSGYKIIAQSELITHQLFIILRGYVIIDQLNQKQTEDNTKRAILLSVSTLFMNMCYFINDINITKFKELFFYKPLIDELAHCLYEIDTYGKYLDDLLHLRSVGSLLIVLRKIKRKHITTNEDSLITPIFFAVVQCLCSSYAVDMIKSLKPNFVQNLDERQMLFLDAMPFYLRWYWGFHDPENFIKILKILLSDFTIWFTSCRPESYLQRCSQIDSITRHLSYVLIRPTEFSHMNLFSEEFHDDYCKLVLHWSSILSSIFAFPSYEVDVKLTVRISLQILYSFTLHSNIVNFMKSIPNLVTTLLKATELDHDETQLNAYRCLGKIMIEADIKTMVKPNKIAAVYIDFIKNTIHDSNMTERLHSLLESLKNFVQHDQVKSELIKQEAFPLLIMCVVRQDLDPIKVQLQALEILFALSFHSDTCLILRQNENFISHIRILATKTNWNQLRMQRAAAGLLWKLEKEDKAVAKPNTLNSYNYDVMISYSHKDKDSCFQIHEQLVKDGFRVWLDRNCLRGSTMVGIANAIENSKYVIICMSNMYKQSVYCQSEAHYAFERGCRLIPVIIESNYKPDGWLGIIASGKVYVDFSNVVFSEAYEKLKNEVSEQEHQNSIESSEKSEEKYQINTNSITSDHSELATQSAM